MTSDNKGERPPGRRSGLHQRVNQHHRHDDKPDILPPPTILLRVGALSSSVTFPSDPGQLKLRPLGTSPAKQQIDMASQRPGSSECDRSGKSWENRHAAINADLGRTFGTVS